MKLWLLLCAVIDVGWSQDLGSLPKPWDQPTSTTAHNSHQNCIRVVIPDDGQVMRETCRGFERQYSDSVREVCVKFVCILRNYVTMIHHQQNIKNIKKLYCIVCTGLHLLRGNWPIKLKVFSLIPKSLFHVTVEQEVLEFTSSSPKQLTSNYGLGPFRFSPDTTLSRYDISCTLSYVSLPSCSLSTCRISALRLCWISECSASSYRAKLIVLEVVSWPAIRNVNACATNKSPSISEKVE
jgi:hypothetical protein